MRTQRASCTSKHQEKQFYLTKENRAEGGNTAGTSKPARQIRGLCHPVNARPKFCKRFWGDINNSDNDTSTHFMPGQGERLN